MKYIVTQNPERCIKALRYRFKRRSIKSYRINKEDIIELLDKGLSQSKIAEELGCSRQNISYIIKKNNYAKS